MRKIIKYGYLVRAVKPEEQLTDKRLAITTEGYFSLMTYFT